MEKNPKLIIFYSHFLKKDGSFYIGGIQTYIHLLIQTFEKRYNIIVIQCNNDSFKLNEKKFKLISLGHRDPKKGTNYVENEILKDSKDILIYASEQFCFKGEWKNSLVIQHGIYWDLPVIMYKNRIRNVFLQQLFKVYDNYRNFKRIQPFKNVVCVDYNYINWFRTITSGNSYKNFYPVYNCAREDFFSLSSPIKSPSEPVKILFARRFVNIRGVHIFIKVALELVVRYKNISIILVGDGPELEWIQEKVQGISEIIIMTATYDEMPKIMNSADIVVIPSLGSEGTSLSAIEGMAAGKVILATNVGGLTNLIINGYNGFLTDITAKGLLSTLSMLIENPETRKQISENAKEVASKSFHYDGWAQKWSNILEKISNENNK